LFEYSTSFLKTLPNHNQILQKTELSKKTKVRLLSLSFAAISIISLPFVLSHILVGHGSYFLIHIGSIALGSFLSLIGIYTYLEFKTTRLFLVMCAFVAITMAECYSIVGMILQPLEFMAGIDVLISHSLILLMLSFFVAGIFKSN